jgi:FO synthase
MIADSALRRCLRRARDGVALDAGEAAVLMHARGSALIDLCASAGRVRDAGLAAAGRPGTVTYSPKVFVPITKLCRDRCHYCTFASTPKELQRRGEHLFMSPEEIREVAARGADLGCAEALFTLGDRP